MTGVIHCPQSGGGIQPATGKPGEGDLRSHAEPAPSPVRGAGFLSCGCEKLPKPGTFAAKMAGCVSLHISPSTVTTSSSHKNSDIHKLDALTGGAFTSATAGERAARIRDWIASNPAPEHLAEVFRELSVKDKGAAKLVREKIDEARRARGQEALAEEWAAKAQALVSQAKLNIADAMAWQRDAAKAGAPLSREPLASLRSQLADRVKGIEDLQHQVQVQREAAVLLAQRIEVLSTKSWLDAQGAAESLRADIGHWQAQAADLVAHAGWPSVDLKFPPLLEASKGQLLVVWEAFEAALGQTVAAAADPTAPLPPVPVWADELRAARGLAVEPAAKPAKPQVDPQVRAAAVEAVREALAKLEAEISEGHGKASAGAAAALRNALKEFGKLVDGKLENQAHAALAAAGELEGWQRWRADQLREELVAKAEGLLNRPAGQAIGGRKMQETLRTLREQWKQTDQGGVPNHGLWKRFDEACNQAHKVVEAWLEKMKAEAAEHKAHRMALIDEVNQWAAANRQALDDDWKGFARIVHQFADRWRDAGHVGEKVFAELQPLWKQAIANAAAPLEAVQAQSLAIRQAMIAEAQTLGAAPVLRVDAVKALQQRWQAEAHRIPMERRQEQKLWDAFRKPIDEAFQRKTAEREKAEAALGARDRSVIDAAKALEAANASGDAQRIRTAMAALEAALRGQAEARQVAADAGASEQAAGAAAQASADLEVAAPDAAGASAASTAEAAAHDAVPPEGTGDGAGEVSGEAPAAAPAPVKAQPKPVVAVRGDDRPGMKRDAAVAPAGRPGKWGDRKPGDRGDRGDRAERHDRPGGRGPRQDDFGRGPRQDAPRLGDAAFRAQRDALEHAQMALKKLAAQAHGEVLTQLMTAWEQRDGAAVPSASDLGARVPGATRSQWQQALAGQWKLPPKTSAADALLRLEMAAELPTPAEHLDARRALQLQLLTRRNDPAPAQTWGQDVAVVLASPYDAGQARRLQSALKVLLRRH